MVRDCWPGRSYQPDPPEMGGIIALFAAVAFLTYAVALALEACS